MFKKRYDNKKAFTLIELLVVIAIIGILATLSAIALNSARSKARDTKRLSDIKQLQTAIEMYYQYNDYYPQYTAVGNRCNTTLNNSLSVLINSGLMTKIPTDPDYKISPSPRQCYEYVGIGQLIYPTASTWFCNGRPRTDYQWSLLFSLEGDNPDFFRLTNSGGTILNDYKYCLTGPLRPDL